MIKLVSLLVMAILFLGCSGDILGLNGTPTARLLQKLQAQKLKSDKEVESLEQEVSKMQRDLDKYRGDYEKYNNNAILDELDEALNKTDENTTGESVK